MTNSFKIDQKDLKVLRCLDLDARMNINDIAKKTHLSNLIVSSRLQKMIKHKIIKSFISYIDVERLGYTFYDLFVKTKFIKPEDIQKISKKLIEMSSVGWFISVRGRYNLVVCLMAKNSKELRNIINEISLIIGDYMEGYDFFIVSSAYQLPYRILLHERPQEGNAMKLGDSDDIILDDTDKKVINYLSTNARDSLADISDNTGLSVDIVRYRMKQLKDKGILQGYKPLLDVGKLGVMWHILLIKLKNGTDDIILKIDNFVKNRNEVFYVVHGIGAWHMMIEVHTRTHDEFDIFYSEIKKQFEENIDSDTTPLVTEEIKCCFLPKI